MAPDYINLKNRIVGCCIYCGTTNDLTREHATPRGLAGTHTLLKASCRKCANITRDIETKILRGPLYSYRRYKGYRMTEPKKFPKLSEYLVRERDGFFRLKQLDVDVVGSHILLPEFQEPRYYYGTDPSHLRLHQTHFLLTRARQNGLLDVSIAEIQFKQHFDTENFLRFLGKVALCYAYLSYEPHNIKSFITNFVMRGARGSQKKWRFFGSTQSGFIKNDVNPREIIMCVTNDIISIDFKICAELPIVYRVVVGQDISPHKI